MKSLCITCDVIDKVTCYNKCTHTLLINYSPYRKLLQISSRNDESISAAGFSVTVCTNEKKEKSKGKKIKGLIRISK